MWKKISKIVMGVLLGLTLLGVTGVILWDQGIINLSPNKVPQAPSNNKQGSTGSTDKNTAGSTEGAGTEKSIGTVITIALDEWHGWKGIMDGNEGIGRGSGASTFSGLGANVDIMIENDDEEMLQKFINGEVVAMGQSVNEWPYVHARLKDAGVEGQMVVLTDKSLGGDGVVSIGHIPDGIDGLVGHHIAVAEHSAAHIIIEWLMSVSSLSKNDIAQIRADMIFTDSVEGTYEALEKGQADVAVFWEPYIEKARQNLGAEIVITTKSAPNLAIDGIVFRSDFVEQEPELVEKFIQGTLYANTEPSITQEMAYIKQLPDYKGMSDKDILSMRELVVFNNFADNKALFDGVVQNLYQQMSKIWEDLGVETVRNGQNTAFNDEFLLNVESQFGNEVAHVVKVNSKDVQQNDGDVSTLLKHTLTINFEPNVAMIKPESHAQLDEFAKIANILAGAVIQVEGNIADTGAGDTEAGRALSLARANEVIKELVKRGIDEGRFSEAKGNGISSPVKGLDPRSSEGMEANRRTDVFFLKVE